MALHRINDGIRRRIPLPGRFERQNMRQCQRHPIGSVRDMTRHLRAANRRALDLIVVVRVTVELCLTKMNPVCPMMVTGQNE